MSAHPTKQDLSRLIDRLLEAEATLPGEIGPLIKSLISIVEQLPDDGTLAALKKPGAWFDVPLAPSSESQPYFVKTPIKVEVVNMSSVALTEDLLKNPPETVAQGSLVTISAPATPVQST